MMPIPRRLLIHSAEIRTPLSEDVFGAKIFSEPEKLRFIRIEYSEADKTRERDMLNVESGGEACLIYDCANSLPAGFVFKAGQMAEFDGRRFRVTRSETLCGESRPHHIEVSLTEVSR